MTERFTDYDAFAWFYNRYWGTVSTDRFLAVIEQLVLTHIPGDARLLDLGCGTGQLAGALQTQGFRVTGLDASEAMLAFARANAPGVDFLLADARSFPVPQPQHAVLSIFDSLNHVMSLAELARVFRHVHAALLDGGWFLFDLNMLEGYRTRWRGSFALVDADSVCAVRSGYDEEAEVARSDITMFRRTNDAWHRTDCTLHQRCYAEEEVRRSLGEAGFTTVDAYDAVGDLGLARETGRTFFRARKAIRH